MNSADDDIRKLIESVDEIVEDEEEETPNPEEPLKDQVMRLLKGCVDEFERVLPGADLETRIEIAACLVEIRSCLPEELTEEEIFKLTGSYGGT